MSLIGILRNARWNLNLQVARVCLLLLATVGSVVGSAPVSGQTLPVGDVLVDYLRLLQIAGQTEPAGLLIRPLKLDTTIGTVRGRHPWERSRAFQSIYRKRSRQGGIEIWPVYPQFISYFNSTRPSEENDGAVWQGRGWTHSVSAGFLARVGILEVSFRPAFAAVRNEDFSLSPTTQRAEYSRFAYARTGYQIDKPRRFGDAPLHDVDLGESRIMLTFNRTTVGLSNENMWWGPGFRNSIMMTNAGPGFPHATVSSGMKLPWGLGDVSGTAIWGMLRESKYFDYWDENDTRFLTGAVVQYQPAFAPNLFLGAAETLNYRLIRGEVQPAYLFGIVQIPFYNRGPGSGNGVTEPVDKMLSLYARIVLPDSGFELFGEYGLGDRPHGALRAFLLRPEYASARLLGFRKTLLSGPRSRLLLSIEGIWLEAPLTTFLTSGRNGTFFYAHHGDIVSQGYTNKGQMIGAAVGPGSTEQFLGIEYFAPLGRLGMFAFRRVYDNDQYYSISNKSWSHEVEYTGGVEATIFTRVVEVSVRAKISRLLNKYYIFENDDTNVGISFGVRTPLGPR